MGATIDALERAPGPLFVHVPIDLLVSRLRQRLGDDAREPEYIKTVRSEGYVFSLPVRLVEAHP